MKGFRTLTLVSSLLALTLPAHAALDVGTTAPLFTLQASLGGKEFTFALVDALKNGPVVLYFYPAAFTPGCNIEAHDFAQAVDGFKALRTTVIGVSHDSIATLNRFSVSECQGKFPVAADTDMAVTKSYRAALAPFIPRANRTSYVIAPDGRIIYSFTDLSPDDHVANTMRVVEQWSSEHRTAP